MRAFKMGGRIGWRRAAVAAAVGLAVVTLAGGAGLWLRAEPARVDAALGLMDSPLLAVLRVSAYSALVYTLPALVHRFRPDIPVTEAHSLRRPMVIALAVIESPQIASAGAALLRGLH